MRIALYNPPVHHYAGVRYRMNPPLGLPILAAVLNAAGHEARVYDLEALGVPPAGLVRAFARYGDAAPDAVGFTTTQHNARGARECITALRDAGYDGHVVVGGPYATQRVRGAVDTESAWGADAWVAGECEGNVVRLFEERLSGVIEGEPAPIESVPGPDWGVHTPGPLEYGGNLPDVGRPEGIAMWSRGCPHPCTFCGNPVYGRQRVRRRPPGRVYEDMAALKALGARSVFVYDDELPGMPGGDAWLGECCEAIAPLGLAWKCQGRVSEDISPDLLAQMAAAGCKAIMWGVESFSEKVLAAMKKGTTEAGIWHTLRAAHAAGIGNWLFLMVGNYGETAADLAYTARAVGQAAREGLVQWRQVTVCTPVPGTPLYDTAAAEGWLHEPPEVGPQMAQVYSATPWLKERDIRYWRAQLEGAG